MERNIETVDSAANVVHIESVKIDLNKYVVNGGMGFQNIYGRRVQKSLVFPVAKLNYSGNESFERKKFNKTVDLKDASLTATNYVGVGCGKTYFIVSNGKVYSLYDIHGHFIKYISISDYGKIICLGANSFVTKSEERGKMNIWNSDGRCSDNIPITPENINKYCWQKGKLIKKSETFCKCEPDNKEYYF